MFGLCLIVSSCRTKKLASVETTCAGLSTSSGIELELSVPPLPASINLPEDSMQKYAEQICSGVKMAPSNNLTTTTPLKIRIRAHAAANDSSINTMNRRPIDFHAAEPIFAHGTKNPLDTWFTYLVLIMLTIFALRFLKKR